MGQFSIDLSGKTAIVTGATRGIGRAIAELLVANGARVIGLQRGHVEIEGDFTPIQVDLSDLEETRAVVAGLVEHETIDILVNNAGINIRHKFEEFPLEDWDAVLQVNLRALVEITQIVGRQMLERGSGRIINIASMLSFFGGYTASAYGATKGAVGQFTKSIANEWAGRGINVNAVAPGFIDTELNTALVADETRNRQILERIPAGRWGRSDDIAGAVLFLTSDAANYVHGTIIPVDGGYLSR